MFYGNTFIFLNKHAVSAYLDVSKLFVNATVLILLYIKCILTDRIYLEVYNLLHCLLSKSDET